MTKSDYDKYYKKGGTYVIPIEIFNELFDELERLSFNYEQALEDLDKKDNIIKEVREYITSYESIETIQQFDHNKNNEDLDYSTIDEMTRRYMMVHDKILKILDKEVISNEWRKI